MANSFVGTWKTDFVGINDDPKKPTGACTMTVSQFTRTTTRGTILIGMYEAATQKEHPGTMLGNITLEGKSVVWQGTLKRPAGNESGEFNLKLNPDGKGFSGTYTITNDPTPRNWKGTLDLAHVKPPGLTSTGSKK